MAEGGAEQAHALGPGSRGCCSSSIANSGLSLSPSMVGSNTRQRQQLLQKLQTSNQRFTQLMGALVAKYDRPFEEDKLVHIATLTYRAPEGLKLWGGKRVTQRIFQSIQMNLEEEGYLSDGATQRTRCSALNKLPQRPGCLAQRDAESNGVDATLVQRNDIHLKKNDSLPSLPERELYKDCLTRVDVILEDDHPRLITFDSFSRRKDRNAPCDFSPEEKAKPVLGDGANSPWRTSATPPEPPSGLRGPQDTRVMPASHNGSLLARRRALWGESPWGDEDSALDITLGDVYAEMLYSLCKCLPSQKVGLVSTNKYISKGWFAKKRRLNITFMMENSFLKMHKKVHIMPGEKNSLVCRKEDKAVFVPRSGAAGGVKDLESLAPGPTCFQGVSSPVEALRGRLHKLSTCESPSKTGDARRALPRPQAQVAPGLSLPPSLTSAKDRFYPSQQVAPGGDILLQGRHLYRSFVPLSSLQTPKKFPVPCDRLCLEQSTSDASEARLKTVFPRNQVTKAKKSLLFGSDQTPCKAQDTIDCMFDTYSQETSRWAQELLFLKKSGQQSKGLPQSKCKYSLESLGPKDGPPEPQKAATPVGFARSSPCKTALPGAMLKGDFSSPTKRRKVSSFQTWDCFSSSKTRDLATLDGRRPPIGSGDSPRGTFATSRQSGARPFYQGVACESSAQSADRASPEGLKRRGLVFGRP